MKKLTATTLATLIGAGALALLAAAHAGDTAAPADATGTPPHTRHHHGPGMGPDGMGFMGRKLKLTDDQRQQIRTIMQASWQDSAPLRQQVRLIHDQIHAGIVANGYEDSKVRSLLQANSGLLVDLAAQRIATMAKIRAVLTPAQQQQLEQLRNSRPDGPGGMGGPGGMDGFGPDL